MIFESKVIAAIRNRNDLLRASQSDVKIVFDLAPDILTLRESADILHGKGKKFFIHLDLATGIGKDKSGMLYAKSMGVDGIISTRSGIIKAARELGISTVQRFFIVDSHSVETTVESLKQSKAQMIEVMPGGVGKVIKKLREKLSVPIIAGGLIETREETRTALESGASAVSTGAQNLWFNEEK